jgi:hypothetical protein
MKTLLKVSLFLFLYHCTLLPGIAQETNVFYCPSPESKNDKRFDYAIELLHHIFKKTVKSDGPFNLRPAKDMNVGRAIQFLKSGDGKVVNVIWTTPSEDREHSLLPIRIPIRKGLLGYRIFLIRKEDRFKFSAIKTLDELKKLKVGQGHIWNDVQVFKANGFGIVTGSNYEGLFRMLIEGRFDYFSRGINEAPGEYLSRKDKYPNLFLEESILLYYP